MSTFDFNPTEYEPSRGSGERVPSGKYIAKAIGFDEKITNDQTGRYRETVWEVVSDQSGDTAFAGSLIWWNINTHNNSADAERIGREQLSAVCAAVAPGVAISNSDQLLGVDVLLTVKFIPEGTVRPAKGNRQPYTYTSDRNEITRVEHVSAARAQAAPPQATRPVGPTPAVRQAAPAGRPATTPAPTARPAVANGATPPWTARRNGAQA
jgi:hypothetical protein